MWAAKIKKAPRSNNYGAVTKWYRRFDRMKACQRCGYDDEVGILVLHHKDRNRENNHLSNLEILCPNCHALEHLCENKTGWKHKSSTKAYLRMLKARKQNAAS
jgi:5-methylcytosine-specific restriction endonuclease McrA